MKIIFVLDDVNILDDTLTNIKKHAFYCTAQTYLVVPTQNV